MDLFRSCYANPLSLMHHLGWWHILGTKAFPKSLGPNGETWQFKDFQFLKSTEMGLRGFWQVNLFSLMHHLVWMHYWRITTCPQRLGTIVDSWQCRVAQIWIWTERVLGYFGEPNQLGLRWNLARWSHMSYVTCKNFPGFIWEYFL